MRKLTAAAIAAVAVGVLAASLPAQAQPSFGYTGWNRNPNWDGYRYWSRWSANNQNGWRQYGGPTSGSWAFGPALTQNTLGYTVGVALANSDPYYGEGVVYDEHIARCEAHYRSYNPETDMFLGYDGQYHRCNL